MDCKYHYICGLKEARRTKFLPFFGKTYFCIRTSFLAGCRASDLQRLVERAVAFLAKLCGVGRRAGQRSRLELKNASATRVLYVC